MIPVMPHPKSTAHSRTPHRTNVTSRTNGPTVSSESTPKQSPAPTTHHARKAGDVSPGAFTTRSRGPSRPVPPLGERARGRHAWRPVAGRRTPRRARRSRPATRARRRPLGVDAVVELQTDEPCGHGAGEPGGLDEAGQRRRREDAVSTASTSPAQRSMAYRPGPASRLSRNAPAITCAICRTFPARRSASCELAPDRQQLPQRGHVGEEVAVRRDGGVDRSAYGGRQQLGDTAEVVEDQRLVDLGAGGDAPGRHPGHTVRGQGLPPPRRAACRVSSSVILPTGLSELLNGERTPRIERLLKRSVTVLDDSADLPWTLPCVTSG